MTLRHTANGEIWLTRPNAEVENELDAKYNRAPTHPNRWVPRFRYTNFRMLTPYFNGYAYIVGKGASIDALTPNHFKQSAPIICINEAVRTIESLGVSNTIIGVRQDGMSLDMKPKEAFVLVPLGICGLYEDYPNTITCNLKRDLGMPRPAPTICMALALAKKMDVTNIIAYGFDALTDGSLRYCNNQNIRNVESDGRQLLRQPAFIKPYAKGLNIQWIKSDFDGYLTEIW